MSEFKKISRWISEVEQNIKDMHKRRASTEARIAKKINRLVIDAVKNEFWLPQDKVALCNQLDRMSRLLESEDATQTSLEQVEKEVDKIYGNQSDNSSYYFGRKSAGEKERKQMEELSTFDHNSPESRDVNPEFNYDGMRQLVEKGGGKKKDANLVFQKRGLMMLLKQSHGSKCLDNTDDVLAVASDIVKTFKLPRKDVDKVSSILNQHSHLCLDNSRGVRDVVQALIDGFAKTSSWSDFAQSEVDFEDMEQAARLEDDGQYIDDGDLLDVDVPDNYDYEQQDPLNDRDF